MRAHLEILSFVVLGLLSVAQADPRHYYEAPVKRGILGDILGKLNGDGNAAKTNAVKTVTETIRQTVTVGVAGVGGKNGTGGATKTVTVTAAGAAGQAAGNGVQLSFVTTTVFGTGKAPTETITALASTVTQMVTMTMVQMIACGTTVGSPVLPAQASSIALSAASAASKATTAAVVSSSSLAALVSSATAAVTSTTAAAQAVNPAIPASTTSTLAGLAAVGIPDGTVRGIGFLNTAGACVCQVACMNPSFNQAVGIAPAGLASLPVASTSSIPLAAATSLALPITSPAGAAAPGITPLAAASIATMDPASLQGVNQGPSIDLSNLSLTNVINLGALIQATKTA